MHLRAGGVAALRSVRLGAISAALEATAAPSTATTPAAVLTTTTALASAFALARLNWLGLVESHEATLLPLPYVATTFATTRIATL
eukprot:CAMPEP_0183373358 /NCGR_PEP_ID=MMETSP0164_2-20130417/111204_1 /TAXON_ID=221442 /ORGANISM="Coccolithus pelagicus ssp braarudi, Strain PLY182g" /LENGTH=85 /DNA_ID=CAMNT_0025550231 /DNA_START=297 /DNA_END=549 /DNA_ORIENTATION=-